MMIARNCTNATPKFCRSPWKHDLLLLSLCHFPSSLDGQVSQPPLHRRWRSSMLHGGQLPPSTASQGPPGPRILQISPSSLSDPLTLFFFFWWTFLFPVCRLYLLYCCSVEITWKIVTANNNDVGLLVRLD